MDRPPRVQSLILLVAAMTAGCEKSLPTAPSELLTGVTLYEHANFLGRSAHLTSDVRDLEDFEGPCEHTTTDATGTSTISDWNDCVSSIRVAPGWRVEAYRDDNFRGQSISAGADVPNLQLVAGTCDHEGLNDCITSVRVIAPR
jgi:hypothetical protein